jgi:hypothetical protein
LIGVALFAEPVWRSVRAHPQPDFNRPIAEKASPLFIDVRNVLAHQFQRTNDAGGASKLVEGEKTQGITHDERDAGAKEAWPLDASVGDDEGGEAKIGFRLAAMRESLCAPFSSIWKHWKRVRVDSATRATFTGHRCFHGVRRQVVGSYLMRSAGNNLHRRKDARFDQAPNRMVCDA